MLPKDVEILFQDDVILLVNKPEGMLVHRGWGQDPITMCTLTRKMTGGKVYPAHRLDRATSGVLLFALEREAVKALNLMFEQRTITKRYIALVRGLLPEKGLISRPLSKTKGGSKRASYTAFRRLFAIEQNSVVELAPLTGRVHQLRRHLYNPGEGFGGLHYPIIGDKKHGYRWHNKLHQEKHGLERMALHAWSLHFQHPVTEEMCFVMAPVPESIVEPCSRLGVPREVWTRLYEDRGEDWIDEFRKQASEEDVTK